MVSLNQAIFCFYLVLLVRHVNLFRKVILCSESCVSIRFHVASMLFFLFDKLHVIAHILDSYDVVLVAIVLPDHGYEGCICLITFAGFLSSAFSVMCSLLSRIFYFFLLRPCDRQRQLFCFRSFSFYFSQLLKALVVQWICPARFKSDPKCSNLSSSFSRYGKKLIISVCADEFLGTSSCCVSSGIDFWHAGKLL